MAKKYLGINKKKVFQPKFIMRLALKYTFLFLLSILMMSFSSPDYFIRDSEAKYSVEENLKEQYPAYIYVYNRSAYPVQVYFNGSHVGNLGPGQYFTWTVPAGQCYHIRTYWPDGQYYYWDTCLGPNQTQQCII